MNRKKGVKSVLNIFNPFTTLNEPMESLSSKVGAAIKRIRQSKNLTLEQVSQATGIHKGSLSKVENGKQKFTAEFLDQIAHVLGVTTVELYMQADNLELDEGTLRGFVPLISWVQAGAWQEAIDNLHPGQGEKVETTYRAKAHTYALRVRSDSMEPKFPDGCILIVEPEEEPTPGKYVIVRQNGNDVTFKQLVSEGGVLLLKPLNPRYPIMPMSQDAVICGVVKRMEMDV